MSSSVQTEFGAILTRWHAQLPGSLPATRRDYTELGGPPFNRPTFSAAGITSGNRVTTLQAALWVRLNISGVRGARPQGIAVGSPTRRTGVVTQILYYPLGYGMDFLLPVVDSLRAIFHRQSLSSGLVQMRDTEAPDWIEMPEDRAAGWGRVDIATPYWVTEVI